MQAYKPPDRQDNGHTSAGTGDYRACRVKLNSPDRLNALCFANAASTCLVNTSIRSNPTRSGHDPCQPGSRPPRSSYCHGYPGHMPHQRSQMLCRGHRTPSPASLRDRPERTASGCGSGEHAPPSLLWLRHQSEQLHGSGRTDRLRRDRSSAAHGPRPRLPGVPSTNWPHGAAPHRSCRHNPGCADPHNPDQRQALALRVPGILRQHLIRIGPPWIDLWTRLRGPVITKLCRPGPHHLAHRVSRYPQLPADQFDRLAMNEIRTPDLRYRLNNQHPQLAPSIRRGSF